MGERERVSERKKRDVEVRKRTGADWICADRKGGWERGLVCVIEDKSGSEGRSREERDDPFRVHDSAGGPK